MADFYEFGGFRVYRPEKRKKNKAEPTQINPLRKLSTPIWRICSGCNKFTLVNYQNRFHPTRFYCMKCTDSKLD
ncbi:MAG: hypothetical protein U9M95_01515 [Candidatus Altiarchaeota archaeon]|nr:hypothetical protein [Candidatus Altiarchaeota archaeon]